MRTNNRKSTNTSQWTISRWFWFDGLNLHRNYYFIYFQISIHWDIKSTAFRNQQHKVHLDIGWHAYFVNNIGVISSNSRLIINNAWYWILDESEMWIHYDNFQQFEYYHHHYSHSTTITILKSPCSFLLSIIEIDTAI